MPPPRSVILVADDDELFDQHRHVCSVLAGLLRASLPFRLEALSGQRIGDQPVAVQSASQIDFLPLAAVTRIRSSIILYRSIACRIQAAERPSDQPDRGLHSVDILKLVPAEASFDPDQELTLFHPRKWSSVRRLNTFSTALRRRIPSG